MSVILALGRQKLEDNKFKASLETIRPSLTLTKKETHYFFTIIYINQNIFKNKQQKDFKKLN
jgi:hypothetical protein